MSKNIPFNRFYRYVTSVNTTSLIVLGISVCTSILIIILDFGKYSSTPSNPIIKAYLEPLNCFLAVVYFLSDVISNYLFHVAEIRRRDDFFDNSLNSNLADKNSAEYFSNDNIDFGILKMGVNCFENTLFSKTVASKMLLMSIIKSIIVLLFFIGVALFTDKKILITLIQLALPFTILQQTFRLIIYKNRVDRIYDNFKSIFSSTVDTKKEQLILINVISYETLLAWACIQLDSQIFKSVNAQLTGDWEELKKQLNIPTPT